MSAKKWLKAERIRSGKYKLDFIDATGRRVRKVVDAKSQREAEKIGRRLQKETIPIDVPKGITLQKAFSYADINHYAGTRSRQRANENMSKISEYIPVTIPIKDIGFAVLQDLVTMMRSHGYSPATIKRHLAVFSKVLRLQLNLGNLSTMPVFPKIKLVDKKKSIINIEQQKACEELLEGDALDCFIILIETGMRIGELLALKVEDVNIELKKIHIWQSKSGRSRTLPMSQRVYAILVAQVFGKRDAVFPLMTKDRMSAQFRKINRHLKLTGEDRLSPHCLRHSFAVRMLENTGDIYLVKEWLGHESVSTTEVYVKALGSEKMTSSVDVINRLSEGVMNSALSDTHNCNDKHYRNY